MEALINIHQSKMTTPVPASKQIVRVEGELHVIGTTNNASSPLWDSQGIIKMLSPTGGLLGSIRGLATSVYRAMLVDTSGLFAGFAVRTQLTQGPTTIGGNQDKYAFQCVAQGCTAQFLDLVTDITYNNILQEVATPLLRVRRYQTGTATGNGASSAIASFTQNVLKTDENVCLQIGVQDASVFGALGYNQNGTLWLGWRPDSLTTTPSQSLQIFQTGNVSIPLRLDVGTLSATTYLNLPPVAPSQLLPLTLNATEGRVGINTTTPTRSLDVTGDAHVSDSLFVGNKIHGELASAVQPGITGVGVLGGLDIVGDVDVTGSALFSDTVTADTVEATHWIGLPVQDLDPITLDSVNNRVGVNTSSPSVAFEVLGDAWTRGNHIIDGAMTADSWYVGYIPGVKEGWKIYRDPTSFKLFIAAIDTAGVVDTANAVNINYSTGKLVAKQVAVGFGNMVIFAGNGDPEGVYTGNPGSLFMRGDGAAGQQLYTKVTGTGNTGWSLLIPSLLPITLDTTNNRVGINKTSPTQALDITGNILASGTVLATDYSVGTTATVIKSGTGSPEGVVTGGRGSLFMRTDGVLGNGLYYKLSASGATGWEVFDNPYKYAGGPASTFFTPTPTAAGQFTLMKQFPNSEIPLVAGNLYDVTAYMEVSNNSPGTLSSWSYAITLDDTTKAVAFTQQPSIRNGVVQTQGTTIGFTTSETGFTRNLTFKHTMFSASATPTLKLYAVSTATLTGSQSVGLGRCYICVNRLRAWF